MNKVTAVEMHHKTFESIRQTDADQNPQYRHHRKLRCHFLFLQQVMNDKEHHLCQEQNQQKPHAPRLQIDLKKILKYSLRGEIAFQHCHGKIGCKRYSRPYQKGNQKCSDLSPYIF